MNFVDLKGMPVAKTKVECVRQEWQRDHFVCRIQKRMSFQAYCAKYLGWKITTGEKQ